MGNAIAALLAISLLATTMPIVATPVVDLKSGQLDNVLVLAGQPGRTEGAGKQAFQVLGEAEIPNLPPEGSQKNAKLAADLVNGTIVAPGAVFSFNQVVGPRTRARGFVEGLSIVRTSRGSKLVPDVGGGICRVATAIHQAVLKAGLQLLERHSHSMRVEYAEPGEDAAVVWGQWDYKFKNIKNVPIKLLVNADSGKIIAQIVALPAR